jgi:hypothetical protein
MVLGIRKEKVLVVSSLIHMAIKKFSHATWNLIVPTTILSMRHFCKDLEKH